MRNKYVTIFSVMLAFILLSVSAFAETVTKEYNYKDFKAVDVGAGMRLTVTQSDTYSIKVKADDDDIKDLVVKKSGDELSFSFKRSGWFSWSRHGRVEIEITMPALRALDLSGGAMSKIKMDIGSKSFTADISGGAGLSGNLVCGKAYFDLSGGAGVNLSGSGADLKMEGSGGANFRLKDFSVKNVDADLSGGTYATINMNGTLNTDQSGGSRIIYYGNVTLGNTDFSGGAGISKGD